MQGRQGAGRVQGQGTKGRAGLQDSILRFSNPENLKITCLQTFLQLFEKKGEGRAGQGLGSEGLGAGQHRARAKARAKGRAGCRAGRVQGQGTESRAGLQDSILRFSRPENLKITFLQLFEKKGEGRARQGLGSERLGAGQHRARAKARAKGRAGCRAGRAQAGCRGRGQGRVARFLLRFCNFLRGGGFGFRAFRGRAAQGHGRRQGAGAGHRGQGRVARFHFEVFKA